MNTYQNNVINQKRENEDCHHANIRKLLDSNIKLPNISKLSDRISHTCQLSCMFGIKLINSYIIKKSDIAIRPQ